jgi:hypothetical protein
MNEHICNNSGILSAHTLSLYTQVVIKHCVLGGLEEGPGYCVNCQVPKP